MDINLIDPYFATHSECEEIMKLLYNRNVQKYKTINITSTIIFSSLYTEEN